MVHALILTHGSLGQTLLDAAESVLGPQAGVTALSNRGLSLEQITAAVAAELTDEPTVLFVDFCGGSTFVACKFLPERRAACALITGVSLPMLLSFFTKRDTLPFAQLAATVEHDGHRGIQLISS